MAITVDNIIGVLMFPLIMMVGIAAFISTIQSKGTAEMTADDWISAVLAGSTVLVGGSFHVFPMNHGKAGTAAICILMPFGGLAVLSIREFVPAFHQLCRHVLARLRNSVHVMGRSRNPDRGTPARRFPPSSCAQPVGFVRHRSRLAIAARHGSDCIQRAPRGMDRADSGRVGSVWLVAGSEQRCGCNGGRRTRTDVVTV